MQSEILDIVNFSRPEISPKLYSLLHNCQYTSTAVERSFLLLTKQRNFHSENVQKYIINYNNLLYFTIQHHEVKKCNKLINFIFYINF